MVPLLSNSPSIQGNSIGVPSIGLLAAILDSFFHQYHKWWLVGGGGEPQNGGEKNTSSSDILHMDPFVL